MASATAWRPRVRPARHRRSLSETGGPAFRLLSIRHREGWPTTVVAAALVYVGMRLVSAGIILLAQRDQPAVIGLSGTPYLGMIEHWDGEWFRSIALNGYPHHLPHNLGGVIKRNEWAFYPGFPFVTRAVMQLTALNFAAAASLVNLAAGVVAACAIARLLEIRIPRGAALAVVAVWAALPMAPALQLTYSEALAMAALSLALLWLVREQWGRATVAALLLGLIRPMLPPLAVVYAVVVWRRWRRRATEPVASSEGWRMFGGLVLTGAGSALWPALARWFTGVPGAYVRTEAAWRQGRVTPPFEGIVDMQTLVVHGQISRLRLAVLVAVVVVVVLTVIAVRSPRLDPALVTWCVAYLVFNLVAANMHAAELRMLIPLFPLVAVACGVASTRLARWWRLRVWLGVGLGIVGQYAWVMLCLRYLPGGPKAPP